MTAFASPNIGLMPLFEGNPSNFTKFSVIYNIDKNFLLPLGKTNKTYDCAFCPAYFDDALERRNHVLGHFIRKSCNTCNTDVIQICDEWYERHLCIEPECETPLTDLVEVKMENLCDDDESNFILKMKSDPENIDFEDPIECSAFDNDFVGDGFEDIIANPAQYAVKPERDRKIATKKTAFSPYANVPPKLPTNLRSSTATTMTSFEAQEKSSYNCNICKKKLVSKYSLDLHKQTKHGIPIKRSRSRHPIHAHRPKRDFECDICQMIVSTFYSLEQHMNSRHTAHEKRKGLFTCDICQKKICTKKGLQLHMEIHMIKAGEMEKPIGPFMCSYCGKAFVTKYVLKNHEDGHNGIKHQCSHCDKSFRTKQIARKHFMMVHLKAGRATCKYEHCNETFSNKLSMLRHCARKHGMVTNPYPCPICQKEFPNSKYHLDRHLKAHEKNTAKEYVKPAT